MPPRPRPEISAARSLSAVAPLASRWIERVLAAHDPPMTVAQYLALRAIAAGDVTGTELARRAAMSGPAASQLVGALMEFGMIERHPHPSDRRRYGLRLTAIGRGALESAEARLAGELSGLLEGLPRPEVEALSRLLPQLEAALAGTVPPRRPRPPGPPPKP